MIWFSRECRNSGTLFLLFSCGCATGGEGSCRSPIQPPAGHFFLGEKVPKTPSKGKPLRNPRLRGPGISSSMRFTARVHRKVESFAPLTRSCGATLRISAFDLECLEEGHFQVCKNSAWWGRRDRRRPGSVVGAEIQRLVALKNKKRVFQGVSPWMPFWYFSGKGKVHNAPRVGTRNNPK